MAALRINRKEGQLKVILFFKHLIDIYKIYQKMNIYQRRDTHSQPTCSPGKKIKMKIKGKNEKRERKTEENDIN